MRSYHVIGTALVCVTLLGAADAMAQGGSGIQSPKIEKPGTGKPFQSKRIGGLGASGLENYKRPGGFMPVVLRRKTPREEALLVGIGIPFAEAPGGLPYSLSWVDWWEINRDRHVQTLIRDALTVREANADDRDQAIRMLKLALSREESVAASAAIALGRMGATEAVVDLIRITQNPKSESKLITAWLALGLVGGEGRGKFLVQQLPTLDRINTLGCIAALGLMDQLPEGGAEALLKKINPKQPVPEIRRMALWALNEHEPEKHRRLLHELLAKSKKEPYLVMEALEGLGRAGDRRDIDTLVDYAGAKKVGTASKTQIRGRNNNKLENIRAAAQRALSRFDDPADRKQVAEGLGQLDYPFIQQSNAMGEKAQFHFMLSLALIGQQFAPQTLGAVLDGAPTGSGHSWPTGFALGMDKSRPDPGAYSDGPVTRPVNPRRVPKQIISFTPMLHRCYAAISAGLLVHRIDELSGDARARHALEDEAFGPGDLDKIRGDLLDSLIGPLRSPGEKSYTRAACALGLGLSGDKKQIPHLVQVMKNLRKQDEAIFGYIALSLGMLGDQQLPLRLKGYLGPAKKVLDVKAIINKGFDTEYSYEQRMSRRAAVMGLGALGNQNATPLLIGEWGKDSWVSLEVARALGALKDRTIAQDLTALVYQQQNDLAAEVAAYALGDLYDDDYPSRLSRMQRDYMDFYYPIPPHSWHYSRMKPLPLWFKEENMTRGAVGYASMNDHLHRYGNPFLYRYLYPLNPKPATVPLY